MKREIKFRVYDKIQKCMCFHDLGAFIGIEKMTIQPIKCELMQYTGLKDKNGKEIYEGDILRYHTDIFSIHFRETAFYLSEDLYGTHVAYHLFTNWHLTDDLEIIGNIYENSDLLS